MITTGVFDRHPGLRLIIGHLQEFATQVAGKLEEVEWERQRAIIRALVKKVEIDAGQVHVVFRVGPNPLGSAPPPTVLPDCRRGDCPPFGKVRSRMQR